MDEVGEDESGVEYEQDEQSEEDIAAEQVEREVQQARAQVEPARGGANPGELAEAEGCAHPEEDPARERERRRQRLRVELRSAQQERDDLRLMLQQLERNPSCPARRYSHADVRHSEQGIICCVFRNAVQQHYSDSCLAIMDAETRRQYLIERGRCLKCPGENCRGGVDCPRRNASCFYCHEYSHHAAVCPMPDQTRDVRYRMEELNLGLEEAMNKVKRRRRRLERFDAKQRI
ncbi:hypothetical protein RB195_021804 [Necator americanus]|uniref:Uncharacterized protein n=1 Tax=Necator americanus TaxID=51031 RepID=A0ABR1ECQ4_NECAM